MNKTSTGRAWVPALGVGLCALVAASAVAPAAWAADAPAKAAPATVNVSRYQIEGNTLLDAALVDEVLKAYLGARTPAELGQAAQAVQQRFRSAGHSAVLVYLPEQAVKDGVVVLRVLEGRLAHVSVSGNRRVTAAQVRAALPALVEGRSPQVALIDTQVQLANLNPSRQLAVVLEEGTARGEVDARITVTERHPQAWTLSLDNSGNRATGEARLGLSWQHADLFKRDHQLQVQVQTSPDHPSQVRIASATYRAPLPDWASLFTVYGAYSSVNAGVSGSAAGAVQFAGQGRVLGMNLSRQLDRWRGIDQRLSIGLDSRDYLNDCSVQGLPAGACGAAGESVTVRPASLQYNALMPGELPASLEVTALHNLGLGGPHAGQASVQAVRPGGRLLYRALRLSAAVAGSAPAGWQWQARVQTQASPDALVPGEQLGLAGAGTVRGYEERELSADSGAVASLEFTSPAWSQGAGGAADAEALSWRVAAFADAAKGWMRADTACRPGAGSSCAIASAGLGLRLAKGPRTQLRLDAALPLKDGRSTTAHNVRFHLQASHAFE